MTPNETEAAVTRPSWYGGTDEEWAALGGAGRAELIRVFALTCSPSATRTQARRDRSKGR